jgi:predicted RNA-binding protein
MCLSTVYKGSADDANMMYRNIAELKIEDGKILLTDLMGIRSEVEGTIEKIDLLENYIIVKEA